MTRILILAITCLVLFNVELKAQIFLINEMPRAMYYDKLSLRVTKFKDFRNMRDVFHSDKALLGDNIFSGTVGYHTGKVLFGVHEGVRREEWRHAMSFTLRTRVVEEFFINTTFFYNFNQRANAPWIGDYSYSFGRFNWRPRSWSYGYENYMSNKYTDNLKEMGLNFLRGQWFVSYGHYLPPKLHKLVKIDSTTTFKISYFAKYAIKYHNNNGELVGDVWNGRPVFGVSARYLFWKNLFVEGAANYYISEAKKQPWDPDFTYSFGYFDYRHFRGSISYGNWAINRFPWNPQYFPEYGFMNGEFRLAFNYVW